MFPQDPWPLVGGEIQPSPKLSGGEGTWEETLGLLSPPVLWSCSGLPLSEHNWKPEGLIPLVEAASGITEQHGEGREELQMGKQRSPVHGPTSIVPSLSPTSFQAVLLLLETIQNNPLNLVTQGGVFLL